MKKRIALLLGIILIATLFAGCGGDDKTDGNDKANADSAGDSSIVDNEKSSYDGSSYGIDLTSPELQQMSEKRAAQDKLVKTVREWLEGATMFPEGTEMGSRTYKDFVDYIGCDATEYKFDSSYNARMYTWISEESDNSILSVWFKEINGVWSLSFTGSANL